MGTDHLQVPSLSPPWSSSGLWADRGSPARSLGGKMKPPEASPRQWSSQDAAAFSPPGRPCWLGGCALCPPLLAPAHLVPQGAGLTAQCLLAARVVGQGPGQGYEASLAALRGRALGLALHRDTLHRHRALVAHAGLAVADPPLSRLEQTRSGSPRAPGRCPASQLYPAAPGQPSPPPPATTLEQPRDGCMAHRGAPHQPLHSCPATAAAQDQGTPHSLPPSA